MSPDEVFAAQMWPWPDPTIRRDAMGRVLFVNAAFLQLYGGSVEDWRGNIITGWHSPQAPGVPYRFEVRVPTDAGESVYDWIEFSLADGRALAVARDVSTLLAQPIPAAVPVTLPEQAVQAVPEVETYQEPAFQEPAYQEPEPGEAAYQEPVQQLVAEEPAPAPIPEPIVEVQVEVAPAPLPDVIEPIVTVEAEDRAAPLETTLEKDDTHYTTPEAEPVAETPVEAPVQAAPVDATPPAAASETEDRAYERRALPIENGDAVLGNNWRDAVIAKAVGAEPPKQEDAAAMPAAAAPAPEIPSSDGPLKILLAEDNAINALLTRTLLEADGCSVDTVEDGAKAVEAAKAQHYDLIFMDMRMPNMDGLEATRKIRALSNRSKSLPIIALTANAFDDDRNACFDSGMNDFMTKPVSAEELSEMVKTWTKNRDQRMAS